MAIQVRLIYREEPSKPATEPEGAAPRLTAVAFLVVVEVQLRAGVADPQGATIERAFPTLGFDGISGVRVGKCIRFTLDAADETAARAEVEDLCQRFLTNPVIEQADVRIEELTSA
jgi:phosphoribosylformylglycinamidine synthase